MRPRATAPGRPKQGPTLSEGHSRYTASGVSSSSHEVRIIGGQWKRSKLPVANTPGLRPTPDRVRETLFNWLGQHLDGWRCLDAFAGSGALGFEAASRGATEVTLIERDSKLVRGLHAVRERLEADTVRIEVADALAWMARSAPDRFELVFIDPPFDANLFEPALKAAARVVVPGGFIYLEADRAFDDVAALAEQRLRLHRHGRAGAVHFHLMQRSEPS
ncbi:MAG: 16S rRNA (guanine(966)-N(2))-methyltransferase RsmD [Cytophagales bacterium]|nr:16S rRNA (guanine(966)-N(2))-methyltransferase RsmD [Rhizobacter sp.]